MTLADAKPLLGTSALSPDKCRQTTYSIVLSVVLSLAFLAVFWHPASYFRNPESMRSFFGGESPEGSWQWQGAWSWQQAPFKYRILFHQVVDWSACALLRLMPDHNTLVVYYWALALVSFLSFVWAGIALANLLGSIGFGNLARAMGVVVWLAIPAVHNAYLYPMDSKEDFLGYAIFFKGIEAIVRDRRRSILIFTLLGAATRETLLLLPILYVISNAGSFLHTLTCLGAGIAVQIIIRTSMGFEDYAAIEQGLSYNLGHPFAALLGAFFVFGFLWPFITRRFRCDALHDFASSILRPRQVRNMNAPSPEKFDRMFVPAFVILVATHFFLGRMQESRISALLTPWAVAGFVGLWMNQRITSRRLRLCILAPALVMGAILALEFTGVGTHFRETVNPVLGQFAVKSWWFEAYVQLALLAYVLTVFHRSIERQAHSTL